MMVGVVDGGWWMAGGRYWASDEDFPEVDHSFCTPSNDIAAQCSASEGIKRCLKKSIPFKR